MKKLIMLILIFALFAACTKNVEEFNQDNLMLKNQDVLMLKKANKITVINVPGDFATIQDAIINAENGSTILVSEGVYEEQLVIVEKDLTIMGKPGAIIKSPTILPYVTSSFRSVVSIEKCVVTLDGFTVDGAGMGNLNYKFIGVLFLEAGGRINNCIVKDVRNSPMSGGQDGLGIYANNRSDEMKEVFITNNEVFGFQKNGITVNGNWANDYWSGDPQIPTRSNIKAHINGNIITGAGPLGLSLAAQNGIQISRGASGEVKSNEIKDLNYVPDTWASTGILDYYSYAVLIQGNTITDCDPSLYICASNGTKAIKNSFLIEGNIIKPWALQLSGKDIKVINNSFFNFYVGIYVGSSYYGTASNTKLITNRFTNTEYTIYYSGTAGDYKEHATKVY